MTTFQSPYQQYKQHSRPVVQGFLVTEKRIPKIVQPITNPFTKNKVKKFYFRDSDGTCKLATQRWMGSSEYVTQVN